MLALCGASRLYHGELRPKQANPRPSLLGAMSLSTSSFKADVPQAPSGLSADGQLVGPTSSLQATEIEWAHEMLRVWHASLGEHLKTTAGDVLRMRHSNSQALHGFTKARNPQS